GSGGSSGGTLDAMHYCATYCGRLNGCDNTKDQQTCTSACVNSLAAFVPKLRDETIASIETCVNAKDCVTILGGNESVLKTCIEEAAAKIAPSDVASDFCKQLGMTSIKCNMSSNLAECLNSTKIYNDAVLTQAIACTM